MKKIGLFLVVILLAFPAAGCSNNGAVDEGSDEHADHSMIMGDIHEETTSASVLPTFLENHPDSIAQIYERTPHYQELLEHMPCYCGCGESVGHRSTFDCFINERGEDGSIVWDDHGAKCGVCLEIAHASMELYDNGMSEKDIRDLIDEHYKEGYAEPTDTPQPNA
ncbi:PCYCGC domain-containing protein [Alkalihalophilus marmarensis]|uniref:PCYCGC domain-containing protein n=1 Tax=Alkalihalophilus marmarensis TaxID=521377 RepID=UPI00203B652A|nr:PCYCGC domain-containing protein [Alkalihalophilus marmarensis]MCM3489406.1 PCYCGC domain-containing protein [Alkalihalophilus marmarensis]